MLGRLFVTNASGEKRRICRIDTLLGANQYHRKSRPLAPANTILTSCLVALCLIGGEQCVNLVLNHDRSGRAIEVWMDVEKVTLAAESGYGTCQPKDIG